MDDSDVVSSYHI